MDNPNKSSSNPPEMDKDLLEKSWNLYIEIDIILEKAQKECLSLKDTLKLIFPILINKLDCEGVFIKTYDEDLKMKVFNALKKGYKSQPADIKEIEDYAYRKEIYINDDIGTVIAMRIDVSGEYFGVIGTFYDKKLNNDKIDELKKLIHTSIEIIDNYLSMIYNASKKQKAIDRIGEALSDKVLIRGLDKAVNSLNESINFDKMLFLYYQEERETLRLQREYPLNYVYYNKKERIEDSFKKTDSELKKLIYKEEKNLKNNKKDISENLIQKLVLKKYIEMSMIYGTNKEHLVGKIIVSREDKEFNTTQRDILNSFSTLIRQRVVDYNKEYRSLCQFFSPNLVDRILLEDKHYEKFLKPKEQHVAVLYSDISSFTKISEEILKEPSLIGDFIDKWSKKAVDIIWDNGGVFDKMVGDCVIALFGPPFYEYDAKNLCIRAIKTAIEINKWTDELSKTEEYQHLRKSNIIPGLGVSTGINYCSMFVGGFGPNENFTGFSSGMNNTARLQQLAGYRDIFVMDSVKEIIGKGVSGFHFGEIRQAEVKNVKEPIKYYPIKYSLD
jgi:adenylate cyclase